MSDAIDDFIDEVIVDAYGPMSNSRGGAHWGAGQRGTPGEHPDEDGSRRRCNDQRWGAVPRRHERAGCDGPAGADW
jgi:hypothetical protein